ncbi:MAG TPA: bifunctional glutamate N-acetyltransferase/amino-acid acetyltransferase ArgJ [Syntrophomonadaceae bacterium]|jgi:glutamate N-acetyltransferase/amino-acid N-acetyltransferase|nr:bifunctional glutamate N-acetyltransferase/amino-acid acetyltransferase ArgJ [Syntrophomonadaceae bacterium]HRX20960.1 bifunctional glutamate N-acetyltransferase/amino-acid acetyltransferase ArgJ [Syntrophomonadaceae bacterium]
MKLIDGGVTAPQGFTASGVCAGIKVGNTSKKDVAIICSQVPCTAAGVFTTNVVRAACIDFNKKQLADGKAQAIIVNSGNANACTGAQGMTDTEAMADVTAQCLKIAKEDILTASTGVIGVYMPMDRMISGIQAAAPLLSPQGSDDAAAAIMTTDLFKKQVAVQIEIGGKTVKIGAIAKGSGMIHPNMATMLAFIATDAAISTACLQKLIKSSSNISFNMISVDRDTSTNDMAVIMANGLAGNPVIDDPNSQAFEQFKDALDYINITLAKKIARDGEGASHLIEVKVINAADEKTARTIARSITGSNLTKAAVFGGDANWGRILAAAGYSGAGFDPSKTDIYLGEEKMAEGGMGLLFDEEKARQELQKENVMITVDLNSGAASATAWGCDLSYEYVRINAAYRT